MPSETTLEIDQRRRLSGQTGQPGPHSSIYGLPFFSFTPPPDHCVRTPTHGGTSYRTRTLHAHQTN